MYSGDCC